MLGTSREQEISNGRLECSILLLLVFQSCLVRYFSDLVVVFIAPQRRQAVDRIRKETVKYDASPQLQEFGISVAKDMVKLDGRILPLPDIVQFDNKTTMVKAQDGVY